MQCRELAANPRHGGTAWQRPASHPPMTRYFFDMHNGTGDLIDDEGLDLPDVDAARAQAVESIRAVLSAEVLEGALDLTGYLQVREGQTDVLAIPYAEALALTLPDG